MMNKSFIAFLLLMSIGSSQILTAQENPPPVVDTRQLIAPGATIKKAASQFSFTEGPATDKAGNIYFTDQPNDRIWKYATDGTVSLFMEKTQRSNGMYMDKKGNIVSCADEKGRIIAIHPETKEVTILTEGYKGKQYNGPNDLWIDPKGGIYFTDPYYQRPWWERKKPDLEKMNVYYLPKGKKQAFIVDSLLVQPNGIVGTANGKTLYVADIRDNKTYVYDIGKKGKLTNRRLFVQQGSDGMTLDANGNVYLTGPGVTIYDKTGEKIGHIPVPSRWTANVIFGGADGKTLFMTAVESVYTLQMNIKGQ